MTSGHQRLDIGAVDPKAHQAVAALEGYVRGSGLDHQLYELVKIRASQLNGCAYCLDMHHRDARAEGEDQRRLDVLSAWREAPDLFTARREPHSPSPRSSPASVMPASRTRCGTTSLRTSGSPRSWRC